MSATPTVVEQVHAVIPGVVSQHADEAAFLWKLRDGAVSAPHYSLADLAKLDSRVEAHLDGLRIAGSEGWRVCAESLKWEEPGEVFPAAVLAFESGEQPRIQQILKIVADVPTLADGLISALGWLLFTQAEAHAQTLRVSASIVLSRVGLAVLALHRSDPGQPLREAISASDAALQARALRAVGELGRSDLLPTIRRALANADQNICFAAAWSTALLSVEEASLSVLQKIAESPGPHREKALQMLVRRLDIAAATSWQELLSKDREELRLAVVAAGAIGVPEAMPWLIEQMKIPPLARVASEAFTMITGVGIAYRDLEGEWPEGFEAGPTEDPNDENVELDPDENLPWPNPELVENWWHKNQRQFQKGTRYLCGKPVSIDWLKVVLRDGYQRQRAAAALELAIRQPGTPLFNVKAPGFRQIALLGKPGPPIR